MTLQTPQLVPRDAGSHYHFLNHLMTTKVSADDSGGALTAMEFVGPKGFGPPLHRHDVEDELFYVVEGEVWFGCGDADGVHQAGATIWLPRGHAHTFQIRSDEARVFQVTTPGQFDRFVAALGDPLTSTELPEPGEIDPEQVARIAAEHDIQILGPPPEPLD
ncbi:MAG: cupin domain-containing protein [Actinomycetota bacterium]